MIHIQTFISFSVQKFSLSHQMTIPTVESSHQMTKERHAVPIIIRIGIPVISSLCLIYKLGELSQ
jgi:hypothetical protein